MRCDLSGWKATGAIRMFWNGITQQNGTALILATDLQNTASVGNQIMTQCCRIHSARRIVLCPESLLFGLAAALTTITLHETIAFPFRTELV